MAQEKNDITINDSAPVRSAMDAGQEKLNKQIAMRKRIIRQNYRIMFWLNVVCLLGLGALALLTLLYKDSVYGYLMAAFWLVCAVFCGYDVWVDYKVLHADTSREMLPYLEKKEKKSECGLWALSVPLSLLAGAVLMRWFPLYLAVMGGIGVFVLWICFMMYAAKKNKGKKMILDPEVEKLRELEQKARESV